MKSTIDEIRARFDNDVERFSKLETGQTSIIDSALMLDLAADAAAAVTPAAKSLLDIGCGAGNFTLKLLERLPHVEAITLIDLSRPMLDRAGERIGRPVTAIQGDLRAIDLGTERFDVVVAAAVLHHLRSDAEWEAAFAAIFRAIRAGGSFWIVDMVRHESAAVHDRLWAGYGEYLAKLRDGAYRDHVFAYIAHEDSPHTVTFQLDLLRRTGFREVDLLHKHNCFAAFGGVK